METNKCVGYVKKIKNLQGYSIGMVEGQIIRGWVTLEDFESEDKIEIYTSKMSVYCMYTFPISNKNIIIEGDNITGTFDTKHEQFEVKFKK